MPEIGPESSSIPKTINPARALFERAVGLKNKAKNMIAFNIYKQPKCILVAWHKPVKVETYSTWAEAHERIKVLNSQSGLYTYYIGK